MRKVLLLVLVLFYLRLAAEPLKGAEPEFISERIVDLIDVSQPLILDIQAGDLTPRLEFLIHGMLLSKGADLRDSGHAAFLENPEDLAPFMLQSVNLVKVELDLGDTTVEHKNFLSYRSERVPFYKFRVRQIRLPGNKLLSIDELSFTDGSPKSNGPLLSNLKWFEPILASTALATLIYLLWTIE